KENRAVVQAALVKRWNKGVFGSHSVLSGENLFSTSKAKCCTAVQFCHAWSYSPERMLVLGRIFRPLFIVPSK
ncbi:hypothetical protein, partial [Aeromonas dhakensis]|uniref:hypothetical protein n=1 Tax=Aeromonas dhakensis TaxID=196024 RepID=UPI003BA0D3E2